MNDFIFGNRLYDLRQTAGFTQAYVAHKVGVTNKSVSKWENGTSKPSTNVLRKLAMLFHVSIEELLTLREEKSIPDIKNIVITGGPCAGKTTAMSWIQNAFTQRGYVVLFVPETATELITGGVAPWTCGTNCDYQKCQMKLQIEKEKVFCEAAKTMAQDKVLIVCDRGALDNKAYMDELEFSSVLKSIDVNEVELRDNYDAVFHLVTAAKGAEEFYTTANNAARKETVGEAAQLDDKLISAWTGHPHFRVIDNTTDFENKMRRLISEIASFLGEPEPYEIERKYLIEYPDIQWLENEPKCQRIEIIQTYLKAASGEEVRVRQRGINGNFVYYKTDKRTVSDIKRVEIEKRLSQEEYLSLLMEADTTRRQIRKTRYCLTYCGQYFEIDIYPFWKDKAIAEIELSDENVQVIFPKQIKVIREVTGDEMYKNASLAKIGVEEAPFMKDSSPEQFTISGSLLCRMRDKTKAEQYMFCRPEDNAFIIRTAAEMKPVNDFLENRGYVSAYIEVGDGVDERTHTGDYAYEHIYRGSGGFLDFYNNGASDYNKMYEKESCGGRFPVFLNYERIIFEYRGETENISLTFRYDSSGVVFFWNCNRFSPYSDLRRIELSNFDLDSQRRAEKTATEIGRLLYGDNLLITPT